MPNPDFEYPVGSLVGGAAGLVGSAVGAAVVSAFQHMQNQRLQAMQDGHEAMQDQVISEWLEQFNALEKHACEVVVDLVGQLAAMRAERDEARTERDEANSALFSIAAIRAQARRVRGR
ncbi:ABC-type branched-subunit amino acid transport system permease subunit [Nitrobacteraceae bacterium AZCC 2161]